MADLPVGQLITMGLPGPTLNAGLRRFISEIQPGGFIFFTRNLANPEQIFELIVELRGLCRFEPIITIDQEGGRVSRLNAVAPTPVSADELRRANRFDEAYAHGKLTGKLLSLFGFNLDLAPVVDFFNQKNADNSLRGRCFGSDTENVVGLAGAFLDGLQSTGVLATLKHFPGYSFAEVDPHGGLPRIERTRAQLEKEELAPFKALMPKAHCLMIGHGLFPSLEKEGRPASLSSSVIQRLLRQELGYKGLVMTDDLEMGAIADEYGTEIATRLAVEAGEDMLLICHNPACVQIAHDTLCALPKEQVGLALRSVASFKKHLPPAPGFFDLKAFEKVNEATVKLRENILSTLKLEPAIEN